MGVFHSFLAVAAREKAEILYLVQPVGVHVLLQILGTEPLPVDAATDGRGLK